MKTAQEGLCEHFLEYVKPGPQHKSRASEVLLGIFLCEPDGLGLLTFQGD